MYFVVAKSTSINLRITPEFRQQLEDLAAYHGLTMSSYAHSLLVKSVRAELQEIGVEHKELAPVVARISGGQTKEEIEYDFKNGVHLATSSKQDIPFGKTTHKRKRKSR